MAPNYGFSAGRPFNHYKCPTCYSWTISKDLADGVTPFLIPCQIKLGCKGMAQSSFYRGPQEPNQQHHVEFYFPTPAELDVELQRHKNLHIRNAVYDHVNKGGLLMRPVHRPVR